MVAHKQEIVKSPHTTPPSLDLSGLLLLEMLTGVREGGIVGIHSQTLTKAGGASAARPGFSFFDISSGLRSNIGRAVATARFDEGPQGFGVVADCVADFDELRAVTGPTPAAEGCDFEPECLGGLAFIHQGRVSAYRIGGD